MAFTAQDVKALREMTNCGMMDCKKALVEADRGFEREIKKRVEYFDKLREEKQRAKQKEKQD